MPDARPGARAGTKQGKSMSDLDRNYAAARAGYRADQVAIVPLSVETIAFSLKRLPSS